MTRPTASPGLGASDAWGRTLVYGVAHFGKSLFWYSGELLFAFFLTEVGAIAPERMGVILAAGLMASAIADVAIGLQVRRVLTTPRRAARLQVLGAVASATALMALFGAYWVPAGQRLGYALAISLVFRLAYALYDLPQNALISLATTDDRDRTRVVATRFVFSGLAALSVAAVIAPLLLAGDPQVRALRFSGLSAGFSAVAVASACWLAWTLRPAVAAGPRSVGPVSSASAPRLDGAVGLLIGLMFVSSLAAPVFSKLEPYYAAFALRDPLLGGGVMIGVALGMSFSQPLWAMACKRLSRPMAICLTALTMVAAAGLFLLQAGDWTVLVCGAAFGAASGGLGMTMWAAFGDAVAKQVPGREALSYALFTASSKASLAVSALAIGAFLSRIDYRGDQGGALVVAMSAPSIVAGAACALVAWAWARRDRVGRAALGRPSAEGAGL